MAGGGRDFVTDPQSSRRAHPAIGVSAVLGVLLLLLATHELLAPIDIVTAQGGAFRCGSAVSPPSGAFARSVCGRAADEHLLTAVLYACAAVAVAVGGYLTFRTTPRLAERSSREPA